MTNLSSATLTPSGPSRGFTLIELLVYMLISSVFMTAVFGLLLNQSRYLRGQVEVKDVRETLRGAVAMLSTDLRHASASEGDLYIIKNKSLTLRSVTGSGVICGVHATEPRFALWRPRGSFRTTLQDSVLVPDGAKWKSAGTVTTWTGGGGGLSSCAWSAAHVPDLVVQASDTLLSPAVGTTLHAFRRVEYGIFEWDGRWWLGRKVGSATDYELLTGPLASSDDGGLEFRYFQADGTQTNKPKEVARVEITLRGQSQRAQPTRLTRAGSDKFATDSVTTTVLLRN